MKEKILIVEDDHTTALLIRDGLKLKGYDVVIRNSAEDALDYIRTSIPDLLILDIQLRAISGIELCSMIRKNPSTSSIPIIMLTAMKSESYKVEGLNTGADDYVTKPFSEKELLARVEAVLRRTKRSGVVEKVLDAGDIQINLERREAMVHGKQVDLTQIEFNLLSIFMQKPGIVHTYEFLAETVWGNNRIATSHTIAVAVSRLKEKLGKSAIHIESVPGIGYKFMIKI